MLGGGEGGGVLRDVCVCCGGCLAACCFVDGLVVECAWRFFRTWPLLMCDGIRSR